MLRNGVCGRERENWNIMFPDTLASYILHQMKKTLCCLYFEGQIISFLGYPKTKNLKRLEFNTKFSCNINITINFLLYFKAQVVGNTLLSWSCIMKCCLTPPILRKYMWNNTFKNFKLSFWKEHGNIVGNYSILATRADECLVLSVPYSRHAVSVKLLLPPSFSLQK